MVQITNDRNFKYLLLEGDAKTVLATLPSQSIHCGVTSPPYWAQRDYGVAGQLGREDTPEEYVDNLVAIMEEVKRVLRGDGTFWLNIGDGFCKKSIKGSFLKAQDLIGIPWMVALALRKKGWYLRSDVIWRKLNPQPESVKNRPSKSYEHLFLLSKTKRYFYDYTIIQEKQKEISIRRASSRNHVKERKDYGNPNYAISGDAQDKTYDKMREKLRAGEEVLCNKKDVWETSTGASKAKHFAAYPAELILPCIMASSSTGGVCPRCAKPWKRVSNVDPTIDFSPDCNCGEKKSMPAIVLDPFNGSGTTAAVCHQLGRRYVGAEINPDYVKATVAQFGVHTMIGSDLKDWRVADFAELNSRG